MRIMKIVSAVLFLVLVIQSTHSKIFLAGKLAPAKSNKLRSYIRRLSLKNSAKKSKPVLIKSKPNKSELKKKAHFEVMRDFLSGNSHQNFKQKLQHIKKKYGSNLKNSSNGIKPTTHFPTSPNQRALKLKPNKNRKLQETLIEDELIDYEPSKGPLDLDGHDNALSNVRTINSWVSDLELNLDDLREGLNDKLMNLATGLQKRRMILGHYNHVFKNNNPNPRL
jgi:hypothetical protein